MIIICARACLSLLDSDSLLVWVCSHRGA